MQIKFNGTWIDLLVLTESALNDLYRQITDQRLHVKYTMPLGLDRTAEIARLGNMAQVVCRVRGGEIPRCPTCHGTCVHVAAGITFYLECRNFGCPMAFESVGLTSQNVSDWAAGAAVLAKSL